MGFVFRKLWPKSQGYLYEKMSLYRKHEGQPLPLPQSFELSCFSTPYRGDRIILNDCHCICRNSLSCKKYPRTMRHWTSRWPVRWLNLSDKFGCGWMHLGMGQVTRAVECLKRRLMTKFWDIPQFISTEIFCWKFTWMVSWYKKITFSSGMWAVPPLSLPLSYQSENSSKYVILRKWTILNTIFDF